MLLMIRAVSTLDLPRNKNDTV